MQLSSASDFVVEPVPVDGMKNRLIRCKLHLSWKCHKWQHSNKKGCPACVGLKKTLAPAKKERDMVFVPSEIRKKIDGMIECKLKISPVCHHWQWDTQRGCPACRDYTPDDNETVLPYRQHEVLCMVAIGKTVKEIGLELKVSCKTIEYHIAQLRARLRIPNNIMLVHYALAKGYIDNCFLESESA